MEDFDESSSEGLEPLGEGESVRRANEIVEDLTGEIDELLSNSSSPASLTLQDGPPVVKPRPYQLEMVEESKKRNIIVAMDTGSGKTHIAVMRILYALEHTTPNQFIWFLAPTVSLCDQQYEYIESQISSVQIKFLSGADGVDRWTEQHLWDSILKNVKVVVSTYQILLDALTHAFVRMENLALIVFDEAHNAVNNHPGSKLMRSFYHKRKSEGLTVPHILGLTASPVMRSNPDSLTTIEETLDAICRTPTKHRAELRLQVKLPIFSQVYHQSLVPEALLTSYTKTLDSLGQAYKGLKISEDPYVLALLEEDTEESNRKLDKILMNHKTWCHNQMKSFHATALTLCKELGAWAANYYISEIVAKVTKLADDANLDFGIWDITNAEKKYLASELQQVAVTRTVSESPAEIPLVTDKVTKLIEILLQKREVFSGIVFVQERVVASVLAHLLTIHPDTREHFRVGTIVGTSAHNYRAHNVGELLDIDAQKNALPLFRSGKTNLVIATSILEEGLDVPACNVVVCFQKPANLKSFVQRRGRARQRDSELILLLDSTDNKVVDWRRLEAEMRSVYENEMRVLQEILVLEDEEIPIALTFRVESTGALLDLENAIPHLYHFCATLPVIDYVDCRPEFICSEVDSTFIRAKVVLPLLVDEAVRTSESLRQWKSEKNAIKDAAFQAYLALYRAGLVNDNLLPLLRHDSIADELTKSTVETRASIVTVKEQLNPWIDIAKAWKVVDDTNSGVHSSVITIDNLDTMIHLPVPIPLVAPFHIFWDSTTEFLVTTREKSTSFGAQSTAKSDTWALLQIAFGHRFPISQAKSVMQFSVDHDCGLALPDRMGNRNAEEALLTPGGFSDTLVRDKINMNIAYTLKDLLARKPSREQVQNPYVGYDDTPQDSAHLSLTRVPRRLDFLHRILPSSSEKPYSVVLPISRCTVDDMPFKLVQLGLFIPSIMHRYEVCLIAEKLSTTLLAEVQISDISLVVTAISASSAREDTNYQKLEFLGDSILKMCTSVQLMAAYPLWHEGYLSAKKDRLIANSRLSRAAIETGLDKFIITKAFTGLKWRPLCIDDLLEVTGDPKRDMSTKVLADVVEALIGAAMVDGDIPKALTCLQVFLPELSWQPLAKRRSFLYQRVPDIELPATLQPVESLIGYQFKKPGLLIEAMTHASYSTGSGSFERLEFLGDSILDNIIVTAMYPCGLSHVQMHLLRTALVNADFLAFICMEWSIEQEVIGLEGEGLPQIKVTSKSLPLWRFMRHMSPKIGILQVATLERFTELREHIKVAIENGTHYPWALLARLEAHKFYSDMMESLLGAVWIDSGSFETCTQVVERMGILKYFRRILNDNVHVWHPKEELGMVTDTESVRYIVSFRKGNEMGEGREYVCGVFVGDVLVVEMTGGVNKEEVKTKAAEAAVRILKEKGMGLKGNVKMGKSAAVVEEETVDGAEKERVEPEQGYNDVDMTIE